MCTGELSLSMVFISPVIFAGLNVVISTLRTITRCPYGLFSSYQFARMPITSIRDRSVLPRLLFVCLFVCFKYRIYPRITRLLRTDHPCPEARPDPSLTLTQTLGRVLYVAHSQGPFFFSCCSFHPPLRDVRHSHILAYNHPANIFPVIHGNRWTPALPWPTIVECASERSTVPVGCHPFHSKHRQNLWLSQAHFSVEITNWKRRFSMLDENIVHMVRTVQFPIWQ